VKKKDWVLLLQHIPG